MQHDFPCNICAKNEFCGGYSNNNFDSKTRVASKVRNSRNKDPIVKLGLFGHDSLEYYAYFTYPWPCVIVLIRVMGNCPRLNIILLHTYNLGNAVFAWFILSWIMHKNSSFNRIESLQIWYKFLYDSWCKICFLCFTPYFIGILSQFAYWIFQGFTNNAFRKHKPPLSHIDIRMVSFLQPTHSRLRNTSNV
jgi:hypothetical protein